MLVLFFLAVATTADKYYTGCVKRQACDAEAKDQDEVLTVQCFTFTEPEEEDMANWTVSKIGKKKRKAWISSQCSFKGTWKEASKECGRIGGRLPLVAEQQNNVLTSAKSECAENERVWLISKFDENINAIREWMKDKTFKKEIDRRWKAKRCWKFSSEFFTHNEKCTDKTSPCFKEKKNCVKAANKQTKDKQERQKLKAPCKEEFRKCKLKCISDKMPHKSELTFQCEDKKLKNRKRKMCLKCSAIEGEKLKLDCGEKFCSNLVGNHCSKTEQETALLRAADDDIKKFCFYSNKRVQLTDNIWASQTICSDLEDACEGIDTKACPNWEDYKTTIPLMTRNKAKLCPECGICLSEKKAKIAVRAQKPHAEFLPLKDQRRYLETDDSDDVDYSEDTDDGSADEERNLESETCSTLKNKIVVPGCFCMFECTDETGAYGCANYDTFNTNCCSQWAMGDKSVDPDGMWWWDCEARFSKNLTKWWTHPIYAERYQTPDSWWAPDKTPIQKTDPEITTARYDTLSYYNSGFSEVEPPVAESEMWTVQDVLKAQTSPTGVDILSF